MPTTTRQDHAWRDVDDALEGFLFDEFVVDTGARRLLRNTEVVPLPSRVFDVLVLLIKYRDRSVQKDEIISTIWDNVVVTDDSLIHAISVLRRALDDDPHHPRYIETIPRRGYRFIATVQTPDHVTTVQRDPEDRAAQAAQVQDEPSAPPAAGPGPRDVWRAPAVLTAALAVALVGVILALVYRPQSAPGVAGGGFDASIHLYQTAPPGTSLASTGVVSPDSNYLAFIARDDVSGATDLWVRSLQGGALRRIPGTEGASMPFWSPDSARIGYFANGKLVTSDLFGETMREIASVTAAAGASWGVDNNILFAEWDKGLFSVSALGDDAVQAVLTLERDARDIAFVWPQFLPDSRRFLYQVVSLDAQRAGAYIGNLDTQQSFRLLETQSSVTFAPPAHLLYLQQDMLIAEQLDPRRFELTGHAVVIARGLSEPRIATEDFVSASADLLAFRQGAAQQGLAWFSRAGEPLRVLATPTTLFNPRLSHDGSSLLASSSVTDDPGLWLVTLDNGHVTRIAVDAIAPVWSPDDMIIAYTSRDGGDLLLRRLDSQQEPITLLSDDGVKILGDWTPDGSALIYTRQSPGSGLDLWIVEVATGATRPLLATAAGETQARLSPDGNWIAYTSDESGAIETYVARFPGLEDKHRISLAGGGQPQWRQDQQELYFLSPDKWIMGVEINSGDEIGFSAPYPLFRTTTSGDPGNARENFSVDATGARFLVDTVLNDDSEGRITVMVNWATRTRESFADTE